MSGSNNEEFQRPDEKGSAEKSQRQLFTIHALVVIITLIGVIRDPASGYRWFVLNLIIFYYAHIPAAALHEVGHALAAILVRWKVYQVVVGWYGRPLLAFTRWGIKWQLNSVPFGGAAYVYPSNEAWFRGKAVIVYLAGPIANLIFAGLCFTYDQRPLSTAASELHVIGAFGFANLVCVLRSILPYQSKMYGYDIDSDGRAVLRALFMPEKVIEESMTGGCVMECQRLLDQRQYSTALRVVEIALKRSPDAFMLLIMKGVIQLDLGQYREARELFLTLMERKNKQPFEEALVLNNIAWTDVMIGDEQLLPEALEFSEKAMRTFGADPAYLSTRGSVLVLAGNVTEGLTLLKEAFSLKEADRKGQALIACMIAIGEHRQGSLQECSRWRKIAEDLHSECPLLARIPTLSTSQLA